MSPDFKLGEGNALQLPGEGQLDAAASYIDELQKGS